MNAIQLGAPPPAAAAGAPPGSLGATGSAAVAPLEGAAADGESPFAAALALANADAAGGPAGSTGVTAEGDAALAALAELAAALAGAAPPTEAEVPTEAQTAGRLDRIAGAGTEESGTNEAADPAVVAQPVAVPLVAEASRVALGVVAGAAGSAQAAPPTAAAPSIAPASVAGAPVPAEVVAGAAAAAVPAAESLTAAAVVAAPEAAGEAVAPAPLDVARVPATAGAAQAAAPAPTGLAATPTAASDASEVARQLAALADAEPIATPPGAAPAVEVAPAESGATLTGAPPPLAQPGGVQSPVAPAGAAAATTEPSPTAVELSGRLGELVQSAALRGDRELRLRLQPPELGQLDVRIEQSPEGLRVSITASSREGHELLARQLPLLQTALEARDLRVERLATELLTENDAAGRPDAGSEQASGRGEAGAGSEDSEAPTWSALAAQQGAAETDAAGDGAPSSEGQAAGPTAADGIDVLA